MHLIGAALAGLVLGGSGATAQTADEKAKLQQALERGALIYAYDQAAWHGTDDLLAKADKRMLDRVGGWIVDGPAGTPEIVFYDKNEAEPQALYVARFRGNKLVSSRMLGAGADRSLSTERKRLVAAKRAAAKDLAGSQATRCVDKPHNSVVLPPAAQGGPILVYFLTPQTRTDAVPFGGHYRVDVPGDGKAAVRPFARSCLTMAVPSGPRKPVALVVAHLLDPVPTEIHVFSSLVVRLPVAVGTSDGRVWMVEGGRRIRLLPAKQTK